MPAVGGCPGRDRRIALTRGKRRVALALPAGLAPGSYRLIACVDARKRVRERNERNNCRVARQPIVIAGAPAPSPGGGPVPSPGGGPAPAPARPPAASDRTAPDTRITAGPEGTSTSRSATFAFSATEPGSTFECRLDGGAFAPCKSPEDLTGLADGGHDFAVRAIDRAGNVDPTPATRAWTVDGDDGPHHGPTDPPADEGFSLCAEAGFGVGTDAGIETGGLAENGETIVAEIEGSSGRSRPRSASSSTTPAACR